MRKRETPRLIPERARTLTAGGKAWRMPRPSEAVRMTSLLRSRSAWMLEEGVKDRLQAGDVSAEQSVRVAMSTLHTAALVGLCWHDIDYDLDAELPARFHRMTDEQIEDFGADVEAELSDAGEVELLATAGAVLIGALVGLAPPSEEEVEAAAGFSQAQPVA